MQELHERNALLDRIRAYADERGIITLTLASLAGDLKMPLSELQEFFQSKEDLIVALVARDRMRQREAYARIDADATGSMLDRSRALWHVFLDAPADSRLLFEAYALGMRDPQYRAFLHGVDDWVEVAQEALVRAGFPRERATAFATLALAIHRGAMMDYCATGERARVNAAMELWFELSLAEIGPNDP